MLTLTEWGTVLVRHCSGPYPPSSTLQRKSSLTVLLLSCNVHANYTATLVVPLSLPLERKQSIAMGVYTACLSLSDSLLDSICTNRASKVRHVVNYC